MDLVPLTRAGRLWKGKADFLKPFRSAAVEVGENIAPLYDPTLPRHDVDEPDLKELNSCLRALVDIFPDVQPEVFREMLLSVSEESRLQVVTEQLLKKKAKWVGGRYKTPAQMKSAAKAKTQSKTDVVPVEETFRSESYRKAVKNVLYQEFKVLSRSTVKGVLAEENYSYTHARPTLQHLASRSWRFSFSSFWPRRSPSSNVGEHPYIIWQTESSTVSPATPVLRRTGSPQLDHELYDLFVAPVLERQRQDRLLADRKFANEVNEAEAEAAHALYDCECCYSSVSFEQISTCDEGPHMLCLDCVRRTTKEALYGQGWARSADLRKSSLLCFASIDCKGSIPRDLVRRALSDGSDSEDLWLEFQDRISNDIMLKSRLTWQRCPFCNYGEVNETPEPRIRKLSWQRPASRSHSINLLLLTILLFLRLFALPFLLLASLLYFFTRHIPPLQSTFANSWRRVHTRRNGLKFRCRNPRCATVSCTRCRASWRDPHVCFETEQTSLRTAIEASATAAIKRTCPKCLLSFVKSSGCNKLVCNCGYTMCYVCRSEITSREGYAHFCQHFRPSGGRCGDCERCDLYGDEDEEEVVRKAVEGAEMAWREKEGGGGCSSSGRPGKDDREGDGESKEREAARFMVEALVGRDARLKWWEGWLDSFLDVVLE